MCRVLGRSEPCATLSVAHVTLWEIFLDLDVLAWIARSGHDLNKILVLNDRCRDREIWIMKHAEAISVSSSTLKR